MENSFLRPPVFYTAAFVLWVVWLTGLFAFQYVALGVYLCFGSLVLWSAVRHRQPGWEVGFVFGLLVLTLPAWVMLAIGLFQWAVG